MTVFVDSWQIKAAKINIKTCVSSLRDLNLPIINLRAEQKIYEKSGLIVIFDSWQLSTGVIAMLLQNWTFLHFRNNCTVSKYQSGAARYLCFTNFKF